MIKEKTKRVVESPLPRLMDLYTRVRLLAVWPDHPYRRGAARACDVLTPLLASHGFTPVEPHVDPVFGPDGDPTPVSSLNDEFDELFHDLIALGWLHDAHDLNRAWMEFTLVDDTPGLAPRHLRDWLAVEDA